MVCRLFILFLSYFNHQREARTPFLPSSITCVLTFTSTFLLILGREGTHKAWKHWELQSRLGDRPPLKLHNPPVCQLPSLVINTVHVPTLNRAQRYWVRDHRPGSKKNWSGRMEGYLGEQYCQMKKTNRKDKDTRNSWNASCTSNRKNSSNYQCCVLSYYYGGP